MEDEVAEPLRRQGKPPTVSSQRAEAVPKGGSVKVNPNFNINFLLDGPDE